ILLATIIMLMMSVQLSEAKTRTRTRPLDPACTPPDLERLSLYINNTVASYGYCEGTEWAFSNFSTSNPTGIQSETSTISMQTASTIKLWILMAVLQDINYGLYTLDSVVEYCSGESNATVNDCLELMIGISDNCATYTMAAKTGLPHVNKLFAQLGMKDSGFHEWCFTDCPGYTSPCPNDDGTNLDNVLSSHDVILGLTQLHNFSAIGQNATYQAYKYLLTAHGWQPMIGYYIPSPVAHKQGWLPADEGFQPFTENDEAIVFSECGDFAASVMITRNWTQPTEDNVALALGAEIGRLAYCTMVPFGVANDGVPCSTTWSTPPPSNDG
ncbi:hypothetical protein SAMD00019534_077720, partial [Acytostelium subglobosum LB1]|uniref:hypothetical protein n=1 Tax=Acytostelium subglobosum LB1 TaxID=1410327 RepID=UPI000644D8D9